MSRPRISINIGDYLRDTRGLHWRYQGPYLLLIFEYWTHGSLPQDDADLARIVGMNRREWRTAKPALMSYFGANWRHNRIEADLRHFAEKSMKAKVAASVSHSVRNANASKTQLQRAHAYLQERNISLPSTQNSELRASKQAVAVQASEASNPSPTPQETAMPKDSDGVEITDAMRKAAQRALAERDTRTQTPSPKLDPFRRRTADECKPSPALDRLVRQQNRTRGIPPDPAATQPHTPRKPGSIPVSGELEAVIQRWRDEGLLDEPKDKPK